MTRTEHVARLGEVVCKVNWVHVGAEETGVRRQPASEGDRIAFAYSAVPL